MEVNGQFHTMADLPSEKEDRRNPWIRDSMGIIFGQKVLEWRKSHHLVWNRITVPGMFKTSPSHFPTKLHRVAVQDQCFDLTFRQRASSI